MRTAKENPQGKEPERAKKRIAILLGTDLHYDRRVLAGILAYVREKPDWQLLRSLGLPAIHRSFFGEIEADGFIVHSDPPKERIPGLERAKIVTIHELPRKSCYEVHTVVNNDYETGRLIAWHMMERGYTNFAFKGMRNRPFSAHRQRGFTEELRRNGIREVPSLLLRRSYRHTKASYFRVEEICDWLQSLPKPIGIMANHDLDALEVVEACSLLGLNIPHEVGIAGVDNDPFYTGASEPPLTSVEQATFRIGFEAAQRLDDLLSGGQPESRIHRIPPERVVVRASTEAEAVEDPLVSRAIGVIRANPQTIRTAEELAHQVGASRSLLDRRFKESLGRTPFAEIQRHRLEHARRLLVHSRWSMTDIAFDCGFGDLKDFSIFFKRQTGMRPSLYRREHARSATAESQ